MSKFSLFRFDAVVNSKLNQYPKAEPFWSPAFGLGGRPATTVDTVDRCPLEVFRKFLKSSQLVIISRGRWDYPDPRTKPQPFHVSPRFHPH